MCRINSTLAQLLNSLSLKLNSPSVNANEQATANASVTLVNPVANTPAVNNSQTASNGTNVLVANTTAANISEINSSGEQNSSIASFSTLQTELAEVRKE